MTEAVETKPETIEVSNLDQFVNYLVRWHDTKVRLLKHMNEIPEGAEIEVEGITEAFTGDLRRGFKLGIIVALSELGTLPFGFETDDEETPVASNDEQVD